MLSEDHDKTRNSHVTFLIHERFAVLLRKLTNYHLCHDRWAASLVSMLPWSTTSSTLMSKRNLSKATSSLMWINCCSFAE